jgi:threonine/homoserine/homoserine lactone efflux protein
MLEYILIGGGFAFAAAIQPGPLQAFFLSSVAQKGWKRTLPAALAPLISDGPIALLSLFVLTRMPAVMIRVLQAAGGVFLIYLAWASYKQWKHQATTGSETKSSVPRTVLQAAAVNILNPNPYLGWSLVLGPIFLEAWQQNPANAAALIVAFYATMVIALAGTILLFGTTRYLGDVGRRKLILVSALVLAVLGIYQLAASLVRATAG